MRRRLLINGTTLVSLLLFVATTALWVRSYWKFNALFYHLNYVTFATVVQPGTFECSVYRERELWDVRYQFFDEEENPVSRGWGGDEFVVYLAFRSPLFRVPFWGLAAAELIAPLLWIIVRFKCRKRAVEGRCPTCGYNLTGNTSGVCPECGTPVPSKPELVV